MKEIEPCHRSKLCWQAVLGHQSSAGCSLAGSITDAPAPSQNIDSLRPEQEQEEQRVSVSLVTIELLSDNENLLGCLCSWVKSWTDGRTSIAEVAEPKAARFLSLQMACTTTTTTKHL